jgi:hypothetical protein
MNIGKDAKALEAAITARAEEIGRQHQYEKAIKKARAELRDRFAIEIVGSLILRMPADNVITPAMCKTVWTIADAMIKEREQ